MILLAQLWHYNIVTGSYCTVGLAYCCWHLEIIVVTFFVDIQHELHVLGVKSLQR